MKVLGGAPSVAAAFPATWRVGADARTRATALCIGAATVVMAGSAVWVGVTSDHLLRPVATGLYRGYLVGAFMLIGLYWWLRRPRSRFGPLLMTFGVLAWIYSWQGSNVPLLFDLGVLVEGPFAFLTFYLFLAFPSGRLETTVDRLLIAALGLSLLVFFGLWALLSPVLAGGGPLSACVPACPANVLQIGTAPDVVKLAGDAELYIGLVAAVGVVLVYARRLAIATRPQRRALIAVAATSLLFLPVFLVFHFSLLVLKVDPARLEGLAWALIGCRILLPLGFLVALWQAELFASRALRRLIDRLASRPTPAQWRDSVAEALDDRALAIAYWDPQTRRHRDADGRELGPTAPGSGRAWVPAERNGRPVAALVVDDALAADPELVRAAASATLLAVENGALEGELRSSRTRILEAGQAERLRIQRDLHDSAQQRLVALGIHLGLAGDAMGGPEDRARVQRLGLEVEEALSELRGVAHGPPLVLREDGVAAALMAATAVAAIPVAVVDRGLRRHPDAVEAAIYHCCLEAVQNAAKHGGPGTRATVSLGEEPGEVTFTVEDDGAGFASGLAGTGAGLANMVERVRAVGGVVVVDSAPGAGTRVSARLPV